MNNEKIKAEKKCIATSMATKCHYIKELLKEAYDYDCCFTSLKSDDENDKWIKDVPKRIEKECLEIIKLNCRLDNLEKEGDEVEQDERSN